MNSFVPKNNSNLSVGAKGLSREGYKGHCFKVYESKIDLPKEVTTRYKIDHNGENPREVCENQGKETKTIFYFEKNKKFAELVTGKKHQIRDYLSKLGYPIYVDRKHGDKKNGESISSFILFEHIWFIR